MNRLEQTVIDDFGEEWSTYTQNKLTPEERKHAFQQYFDIFPFERVGSDSEGFDMGCGSGRWAREMAPRVGKLNCVEPSKKALNVARTNLESCENVQFFEESVNEISLGEESQDFGYCLGVLHHIPDTQGGLNKCAAILKSGAPFLLYLYYDLGGRPYWFRAFWHVSDAVRSVVSKLPFQTKRILTFLIAITVYWPFARFARTVEMAGHSVENIPLSDYRNKSLYFMRTDALDRFGTRLEKRYSKSEITDMLAKAGFERITFSNSPPYHVCIAYKK